MHLGNAGVLKIAKRSVPHLALGFLERYADLDGPEDLRRTLRWARLVSFGRRDTPLIRR